MILKKVFFLTILVGAYVIFSGAQEVSAQTCIGGGGANFVCTSESATSGSAALGFNPTSALMSAVTNTDASSGPCFTCPNTNADGTTAGALTNSMFGEIRDNNNADLGDRSFDPPAQGMTIPSNFECGSGCNDTGAFTFSIPLSTQDFLSAGTTVSTTNPSVGGTVGRAGVRIDLTNDFSYNSDGTTSFTTTVAQTTFIEGHDGDELQTAIISADSSTSPFNPTVGQSGGTINWTQSIQQGGFVLGPLSGSFVYGDSSFDGASAPTGASQSSGTDAIIR